MGKIQTMLFEKQTFFFHISTITKITSAKTKIVRIFHISNNFNLGNLKQKVQSHKPAVLYDVFQRKTSSEKVENKNLHISLNKPAFTTLIL